MKVIGITGGIGTGKSTILGILKEQYNAYIVEADKVAHHLMQQGTKVYHQIVHFFGTEIIGNNNEIRRDLLGKIVFADEQMLEELNAIVHPAVKQFVLEDIQQKAKENKVDIYVIEAALLLEDGYQSICDEIWNVDAPMKTRISRLIKGRGKTEKEWISIMKKQSSPEYYRTNCNVTINNGDSLENTTKIIAELLNRRG